MTIARETYFIYLRNLKTWLAQPAAVIATVLMSAFMFLFFGAPLGGMTQIPGFPSEDYEAYLTAMIIIMAVVFNGSDVAFALLTDMLSGYFDKLLLAPVNRFSILLGTLLVSGTRALVQVVVIVALAFALGVSFEGGLLGVLVVIVAATVFGIATACLGPDHRPPDKERSGDPEQLAPVHAAGLPDHRIHAQGAPVGMVQGSRDPQPGGLRHGRRPNHHHRRLDMGVHSAGSLGAHSDDGDHADGRDLGLRPRHRMSPLGRRQATHPRGNAAGA